MFNAIATVLGAALYATAFVAMEPKFLLALANLKF